MIEVKKNKKNKFFFALSISLLITSYYPFSFFNYPFRTELYSVFLANYFVGIIFYSLIIFFYLYLFFDKKNFFYNLIKNIFFYFVFIFYLNQ